MKFTGTGVKLTIVEQLYVVAECRNTLQLLRWGFDEYGVWTPTAVVNIIEGRGQYKRYAQRRQALIPGYVFVPRYHWKDFRTLAPAKFRVTHHKIDCYGNPWTCTLTELKLLQEAAARFAAVPTDVDGVKRLHTFKIGDHVKVEYHPTLNSGFAGVVTRCKSDGALKIKTDKGFFVEIHSAFVIPFE